MNKIVIAALVVGGAVGWIGWTMSREVADGLTSEIAVNGEDRKPMVTISKLAVVKNVKVFKGDEADVEGDHGHSMNVKLELLTELTDLYIQQRDGKALVDLIIQLTDYAPESYLEIAKIIKVLDWDVGENDFFEGTYDRDDLTNAISGGFYIWVLEPENFNKVDVLVRFRAYEGITLTNSVDWPKTLIRSFALENDHFGRRRLGRSLKRMASAGMAKMMLEALREGKITGRASRQYFTKILFDMPYDNVDLYIAEQLGSNIQADERERLTYYKNKRYPPASGYLIRNVVGKTQAKQMGLRAGDTVLRYAGHDLRTMLLKDAQQQVRGAGTVTMVVLRDGQELTFEVQPGKLGVSGDNVIKK